MVGIEIFSYNWNADDEELIRQIQEIQKKVNPNWKELINIYDARSELAAKGNKVKSGGYENPDYYKCAIIFNDVPNIHAVRSSFEKMFRLCNQYSSFCNELSTEKIKKLDENYLSKLEATSWLSTLDVILIASHRIVQDLTNIDEKKRRNVLIHCSDGWDRTS